MRSPRSGVHSKHAIRLSALTFRPRRPDEKLKAQMPRFLLVFRHADGDRSELHDKTDGQARVNGTPLEDGIVFEFKGMQWVATREDIDNDLVRFVCTPV